jgi:hypothetical protein
MFHDHGRSSIAATETRCLVDLQLIASAFMLERSELLRRFDRTSQPAAHVSAYRDLTGWGLVSAIMREETDHILDHSHGFADLARNPLDFLGADVSIAMLHVLQHQGDARSNLTIH